VRACGTKSGYQGGCRCDACREASNAYQRAYLHHKRYPQWYPPLVDWVPAKQVRDHLLYLRSQGVPLTSIHLAVKDHCSLPSLDRIMRRAQRVRRPIAEAILNVGLDAPKRPLASVPADDTVRRLAELKAVGLPKWRVFAALRVSDRTVSPKEGRVIPAKIQYRFAQAIETFYIRYFHEVLHQATPEEKRELAATERREYRHRRQAA
jgi:hypothetical protein